MKKILYTILIMALAHAAVAQIGENPLVQKNEPKTVVGAIGGSVDVTALGGASYTIPIQLPEGINEMQPSLAVNYNSQSGNGLLGWGWNLSGISAITRVGQTLYHDGQMKGVDFNDDRFALDGQRLLLVNNQPYGGNGAEYRTEVDGMTKIVSYTCDTTNGPACFKVWLPNGNIAYYGYKDNTRIGLQQRHDVCLWLLDSIVDRNGNYVAYKYLKGTSSYRLEQIVYTGNSTVGLSPCFKVKFSYSNRMDNEIAFVGNNVLRQERILTGIKVFNTTSANRLLWEYIFHYDQDVSTGSWLCYNRLTSVDFYCDGKKYNPTTINWETSNPNSSLTNIQIGDGYAGQTSELSFVKFTGDFNGDGYTDVISSGNIHGSGMFNLYLNNGKPDSNRLYLTHEASFERDPNLDWIYVGDFNGDGLDDFMCVIRDRSGLFFDFVTLKPYLTRIRNDGTIWFEECETPNNGDYWIGKRKKLTLIMGDFLGNKKMSFIFQTHRNSKRTHKYIYFVGDDPNGHSFAQKNIEDLNAECMRAADFNGDGITEIWYYSADECDWYGKIVKLTNDYTFEHINDMVLSRKDRTYIGDFNGDGKADLLSYDQNEGLWKIHLWRQTKCHWQSCDITSIMPLGDPGDYGFSLFGFDSQYQAVEVADFNGDGKTDIAAVKKDGTINDKLVILYAPFASNSCAYMQEFKIIGSTDINVMAQDNICVGNFLGKENASLFSEHSLFSIAPITHRYSASTITDGMGNSVSFEYKYLMPNKQQPSENDFYKNTHNRHAIGGSGCFVVSLPMRGVVRLKKNNVNSSYYSDAIAYKYEDAIIHNRGKGFLGFETAWITNGTIASGSTIRRSSIHKRHFDLNSMGSHYSLLMDYDSCYAVARDQSEQVLSSVASYIYVKKVNANNNLVYMPLSVRQTTDQFDIYNNGQFLNRTISRRFYNNDGRDTEAAYYQYTMHLFKTIEGTGLGHNDNEVNHAENGTISETDYQPENYVDWIINRPYSTKTTSFSLEDPSHPVTVMSTYEYEDQNPYKVTRQTVFPGGSIDMSDPLATYTDNIYDEVGNIVHSSSGDLLGQLHVTTVDNIYYPNYRQLQTQTNQAGYETNYTYDPVFGYCNSTTDCNGLVTSYSGDIMGVYTQTISPNGIISRSYTDFVSWTDPLQPQHAFYYELLQQTGEADTKTYYDASGRKLRVVNYGFNGETICVDTKYNGYGLVKSVSEPFFLPNLGNERCSMFEYDRFFRNNLTIAPDETSVETIVDGFTTTTIHHPKPGSNLPEQTTYTIVNASGLTVESVDANGTSVNYAYYPDGKLRWTQIGEDETTRVSLEYDNAGNRTFLKDPDYGIVTSLYNAYGQLCLNTDPKGNTTEYHYDNLGRSIERIETDHVTGVAEYTNWYYDINANDQLDHIIGEHQTIQYQYDQLGRVLSVSEQRDTYWTGMTMSYEYDELSRIRRVTYPTGYSIQKEYNERGYLTRIMNGSGLPLWETLKVNEFGQIVRYMLGENIINTRDFDDSHRLKQSVSESGLGIIQSFSYDYDDFSNLASRKDDKRGMVESFLYDDLNRLTTITMNGVVSSIEYDDYGRIISKMADGQMVFNNARFETFDENGLLKPHAISEANMAINPFPGVNQSIAYTMFDKLRTITQDNRELTYDYGYDHQRIQMVETIDGTVVAEKDYFGNCEIVQKENTIPYTYISGPLGVFAVVKRIMNSDQISFIYKDHLGSWTTISDYDGSVEQELSFDAWGNLRDPETWNGEFTDTPMLDRGYTGHEHLYDFGLINMNGRMYDPVMSSFLSVDNYVQQPDNSQNFNRYAYCLNNPLKYTDPSGEIAVLDDILFAAAVGAVVGVTMNGISNSMNDVGFFQGWWKAAIVGGLAGATGAGVSALGAGAGVVGMAAGAVSGGTSAAFNKTSVLLGVFYGGVSGWIGGGLSQCIGGGWGALVGGALSNLVAQTPGIIMGEKLDYKQLLISGGLSWGVYMGTSYLNWQFRGGKKMGDLDVSFKQFCKMQTLFQKSRAWKIEMGGYLMEDGSFYTSPEGNNCAIDLGPRPEGAIAEFHTHWDKPGKVISFDQNGDYVTNPSQGRFVSRAARYHGDTDFTEGIESVVFNRYDGSYFSGEYMIQNLPNDFIGPPNWVHTPYQIINPPIIRYNYGFLFSIRY